MLTTAERIRTYRGPVILSLGMRPFFLGGAIWAAGIVAIWLPLLAGTLELPNSYTPVEWHAHELIYGYVPAIMTGFLLTAVPNWTGRLPVVGKPLLVLFGLWVAGRLALLASLWIGAVAAALIDLSFLFALSLVLAREILVSGKYKSFRILLIVAVMFCGNTVFHLENIWNHGEGYGLRTGLSAAVMLIMIIGGRVVPGFTRNWMVKNRPRCAIPAAFNRFDGIAIAIGAIALVNWVLAPEAYVTATVFVVAAILHSARLWRWRGMRTTAEPMVFVLHVAYSFIPLGFLLLATSFVFPGFILLSDALHSWTAGAIGMMTLAIMTRAALGHSGRTITATGQILFIYCAAFVAAVSRLVSALDVMRDVMLQISAAAWVLAFLGYVIVFWPVLTQPRATVRPVLPRAE